MARLSSSALGHDNESNTLYLLLKAKGTGEVRVLAAKMGFLILDVLWPNPYTLAFVAIILLLVWLGVQYDKLLQEKSTVGIRNEVRSY